MAKEFDVVVFGATGYTGRLVVKYFAMRNPATRIKWAIAGRDEFRLKSLLQEEGLADHVSCIVVDSEDRDALEAMVNRTSLIVSTVGPYQLYGEGLLAACVKIGVDYIDLCGETHWMRSMIDKYESRAVSGGTRVVFSCGYDSVPFDLGVHFLQSEAKARLGSFCSRVWGRVVAMDGTFSGGTIASGKVTMEAVTADKSILALLVSPYTLCPDFEGPEQPKGSKPVFDSVLNGWSAPFVMAPINVKNIHRSNYLQGHPYGEDFIYDEMYFAGEGEQGRLAALQLASEDQLASSANRVPGEGPSERELEAGKYELFFHGVTEKGDAMRVSVSSEDDPGYVATSKMISECAFSLLEEKKNTAGGFYTPAALYGDALMERLRMHADTQFAVMRD